MNGLKTLRFEPALFSYALVVVGSVIAAFFAHVTKGQEAAIVTIGTGLAAIYTAVEARPIQVPVISGATGTVLAAAAAYGLHLAPAQIAAVTAGLSLFLSLIFRVHLTPLVNMPPQPNVTVKVASLQEKAQWT